MKENMEEGNRKESGRRNVLDKSIRFYLNLALIGILIILVFSLIIRPIIIGYVTGEREYQYSDDLGVVVNETTEYMWLPEHEGDLSSIRISGNLIGSAKVYIESGGIRYLIYDSSQEGIAGITGYDVAIAALEDQINQSTNETVNQSNELIENLTSALVNETPSQINDTIENETSINESIETNQSILINETINQSELIENETIELIDETVINETIINETEEKHIEIKLEYNSGTDFDPDDDGIESIEGGVIDFTVKNSLFNWDINESKLCTRWETYSRENKESTVICYGNDECCNFVGVQPYQPNWNETLFLNYGRHGSTENNIVYAHVVYFDYSEDLRELDAQVSDVSDLRAVFKSSIISFKNVCLETCSLISFGKEPYKLIFELENKSKLELDKITYSIKVKNKRPVFSHIPNQEIIKNTNLTINLSKYAYDPDGDNLTFTYYLPKNITISLEDDTSTIIPDINLTGIRYSYFIANDSRSIAISNVFKVEVVERKQVKIAPKIKDAKGRSVRANIKFIDNETKQLKLQKEIGPEINITEEPELEEGVYEIRIEPEAHPVNKIVFKEIHIKENLTELVGLDDAPETGDFIEVYAIDPTKINFTEAEVTATAKGTELYKCKDWNFTSQSCYGEWIKLMDITPGQEYSFNLTPEDPGLAELGGVFFDGFESNSLATNNWTTSGAGAPWAISTIDPYAGTYLIRTDDTDAVSLIETTISTVYYANITLSFYYEANGLDTKDGEYFAAQWYNGTGWATVLNITSTSGWALFNQTLPSQASTNPNFKIRFICFSGRNNEECKVDNVQVDGRVYEFIPPNVTVTAPSAGSVFQTLKTIEISANVTDNIAVHTVLANITFPNSTLEQIVLTNDVGGRYNNTFFIPGLEGPYNVTFIANDTYGNVNSSETTYFIADETPPTSNSPADEVVDLGEVSSISWTLYDDVAPGFFYVEREGTQFTSPAVWLNNTPVIVPPNNNFLGTWNYTVFYNDSAGNYGLPDTIFVTVNDTTTPTCEGADGNSPSFVDITVDGDMSDWDPVLSNENNFVFDLTEAAGDEDTGISVADRDLVTFAYTWNDEQLNFFFRRLSSGNTLIHMLVYLDLDHDGYMNASDKVLRFKWSGSNQNYDSDLYNYVPAGTADLLNGSGYDMPGSLSVNQSLESKVPGGSEEGIELETRINWSFLGLSKPQAILFKGASSLGVNLPSQLMDNTNLLSSLYAIILFEPDHSTAAKAGTSVYYPHDLMNCGIREETIELTNTSSQGFNLTLYYPNGTIVTDTTGDGRPDINLDVYNYTTLIVRIDIPETTPAGTTDITIINASSSVVDTVSKLVTDTTSIGDISIDPNYRRITVTPGITATFEYTVTSYQGLADTIELSTTSYNGAAYWNISLYYANGTPLTDTDGDNHIDVGILLPSESKDILIKFFIPHNETIGTNDTIIIWANSSLDPSTIAKSIINMTVRNRIAIDQDYARSVGIGSNTYYYLTVTNSWNESDIVDITHTYILNWSTTFLELDKATLIPDTDNDSIPDTGLIGPYGGEYSFYVRVTTPVDALENETETTTIYVNSSWNSSVFDFAVINTTAQRVITYAESARQTEKTIFELGETIYGRAFNLNGIREVYYQWVNPNATIMRVSHDIDVSAEDNADDQFTTNSSSLVGAWYVIVFNAKTDAEIGRAIFYVEDNIPPTIYYYYPPTGSYQTLLTTIEISANVSDNGQVHVVLANLTYPNGTKETLNLAWDTGDRYNTSLYLPPLVGKYNITYIANDTGGNYDYVYSYFYAREYNAPSITNITPIANSSLNISQTIEIGANVTDDIEVHSVWIDIELPNGTSQVYYLNSSGGDWYNTSYTIPNLSGVFNISFYANDTSGNINNSEYTYFYVTDYYAPSVFDIRPVANTTVTTPTIEIAANVTDDVEVDTVIANIILPNSTVDQVYLSWVVGDKYNYSYDVPSLRGVYYVNFIANDTSNNVNNTENTTFTVPNFLPTHENPILNTTYGMNSTSENLTVYYQNVTDKDYDPITNITDWRLNGQSIALLNMPLDTNVSENSTGAIRDYSTYENHGTLGGGNYAFAPYWTTDGIVGGAHEFDGLNDYIEIGDVEDFVDVNSFTIEAWIKKESNSSDLQQIVSRKRDIGIDAGYYLAVTSDNRIEAKVADDLNLTLKNSTDLISLGTWHHVVMVLDRNSETLQLYIDGQAQGTPTNLTPYNIDPSTNASIRIGASSNETPSQFFNGTIDEVKIYLRPLSAEQIQTNYVAGSNALDIQTLVSEETGYGDKWTVAVTPNDGIGDGITKLSNRVTIAANLPPTAPILVYPENNSSIIDRTPTFIWNNSYDPENDTVSYRLVVDEDITFNSTDIDVNSIAETPIQTNYTSPIELEVDTVYYWRVRGYDNYSYGNWSTVFNFTIESYAAISLITDIINFSTVVPSYTDNTTDNNPGPFLLENQGNIHLNVTVTGTRMFSEGTFPGENLQFKIDINETNSFNYGTSTTSWTNVTNESSVVDIADFDWHDISDTAEGDILIRVPDEEPSGGKNSSVTFSVV
ncbi:hypothetical protein KY360_03890 [Candidatus Woesearchaeota archaeon]|nr:hypothetical protein [Candidatus Woesearchaeota archaeon]